MKERELSIYIGKRIKELRKKKRITQSELGKKIGVQNNTISAYERGAISTDQDVLFKLSESLNVSINEFFPEFDRSGEIVENYIYYPTAISAGTPFSVDGIDHPNTMQLPARVMGKYTGDNDIFITRIFGDSMDRIMHDGSFIAVKPVTLDKLHDGDIVVYSTEHEYSVKHIYISNDNLVFKPNSTNEKHFDQVYSKEDNITIHGKVVLSIVNFD